MERGIHVCVYVSQLKALQALILLTTSSQVLFSSVLIYIVKQAVFSLIFPCLIVLYA